MKRVRLNSANRALSTVNFSLNCLDNALASDYGFGLLCALTNQDIKELLHWQESKLPLNLF